MRVVFQLILVAGMAASSGCAVAPKEVVQLSEIVDRQVVEMESSHEKFVHLYYDKLRADVDTFMETRWIPTFLSNVIEGDPADPAGGAFRRRLDRGYKLGTLDWNAAVQVQAIPDPDVQAAVREAVKAAAEQKQAALGRVFLEFSKQAQKAINDQRRELLAPIDEQEALVLGELRAGYADLQRGSAAVKGYLASVVKLTEERDVVLAKLGLLDDQRRLVRDSVRASDEAAKALRTADDSRAAVDEFLAALARLKDKTPTPGRDPRGTTHPTGG